MKPINTNLPIVGFWDTRQGGRTENQDSCGFIDTPLGLIAVVCDGMGGGPAGQLASNTAVQKIVEYVMNAPQEETRMEVMKKAVEYAHHTILGITNENPRLKGMGTTVASVLINSDSAIIAHVGDSRVYQLRRGHKIFRTADHSYVAELVRSGEISEERARLHPQSNLLLKALGGNQNNLADVEERPYEADDRFMICTDGIWGMLPEKELIQKTARIPSLAGAVDGTILEVDELGRKNGNTHDNMTIALLETKQDSKLKEKMSKKVLRIMQILAAVCVVSLLINVFLAVKLFTPSDSEKQLTILNEQIKERDQQILDLQKEINKLNGDVAKSKQETADAKLEVAEEQTKAAKRAQEEAEKKVKEAQAAAERAKASAQQAQKAAKDINSRISAVVNTLAQARDKKEGKERKNLRAKASSDLKTLATKDPKHKAIYEDVIKQLSYTVATSNTEKGKGHYNVLINRLKTIK